MPIDQRTRERSTYKQVTHNYDLLIEGTNTGCNGSLVTWYSFPVAGIYDGPFSEESITDVTCSDGVDCPENKRKYKPVDHFRREYTNLGPVQVPSGKFPQFGDCSVNDTSARLTCVYRYPASVVDMQAEMDSFFQASSSFFNTFFTEDELNIAIRKIRPTFEKMQVDTTNVWAMLLELGDMKKLVPGLKDAVSTASTVNDISDNAAGGWLTWNWGVAPVIGDLETLSTIADRLDAVVDKWNNFAKEGRIMNFHETIARSQAGDSSETSESSTGPDQSGWTYELLADAEYTARLHLYVKPRFIPDADRFRLLIEALGLDKPFTGIWEATPFSWLVDYVSNIGNMIEAMESTARQLFRYDIVDCGYSEKTNRFYSKSTTEHFYAGSIITNLDSIEDERYIRNPLPPHLFGSNPDLELEWDPNLNPSQLTNLAAVRKLWH